MDATPSQIKIHGISRESAADFAFDHDTESSDLLTELVPDLDNWGAVGWMELIDFEFDAKQNIINVMVETKWEPPVEWLRNASIGTHYFENKLLTMSTIQRFHEPTATAVAIMDGEVLQHKCIFKMEAKEMAKYHDDEFDNYNLNTLDNQMWDSIAKFVTVCEQFYLKGDKEND